MEQVQHSISAIDLAGSARVLSHTAPSTAPPIESTSVGGINEEESGAGSDGARAQTCKAEEETIKGGGKAGKDGAAGPEPGIEPEPPAQG
jgi:hypothetical protein